MSREPFRRIGRVIHRAVAVIVHAVAGKIEGGGVHLGVGVVAIVRSREAVVVAVALGRAEGKIGRGVLGFVPGIGRSARRNWRRTMGETERENQRRDSVTLIGKWPDIRRPGAIKATRSGCGR